MLPAPLLDELRRIPEAAAPEDLPALVGALAEAQARALARLTAATTASRETNERDENLSAAEAARRLGMSRDWLYRNAERLPFAFRIGRRVVFSARGLERWNRSRRAC